MDTWAPGRGQTTVADLMAAIRPAISHADGLTVSGGEPFEQPEALAELLRGWRAAGGGDVLTYSGRPFEEIAPMLRELDGLIDAVIADPFQRDLPQTLALRGSDNQRLVPLTARGAARFDAYQAPTAADDRVLDVLFDDESGDAFLAGIPHRGDLTRLAELLRAGGHSAGTTEDVR
jgi:anaerobic ribonucleoside-triphosphate reductase activating protein